MVSRYWHLLFFFSSFLFDRPTAQKPLVKNPPFKESTDCRLMAIMSILVRCWLSQTMGTGERPYYWYYCKSNKCFVGCQLAVVSSAAGTSSEALHRIKLPKSQTKCRYKTRKIVGFRPMGGGGIMKSNDKVSLLSWIVYFFRPLTVLF